MSLLDTNKATLIGQLWKEILEIQQKRVQYRRHLKTLYVLVQTDALLLCHE